jgi:hypothetical protein
MWLAFPWLRRGIIYRGKDLSQLLFVIVIKIYAIYLDLG